MWPDFMPGDPEKDKKKNWNPFENESSNDLFGPRGGSPIDRFNREETDMFGNHIQDDGPNYFDNDGMRPNYMAAKDGDKKDKRKEKATSQGGGDSPSLDDLKNNPPDHPEYKAPKSGGAISKVNLENLLQYCNKRQ